MPNKNEAVPGLVITDELGNTIIMDEDGTPQLLYPLDAPHIIELNQTIDMQQRLIEWQKLTINRRGQRLLETEEELKLLKTAKDVKKRGK